LAEKLPKDLVGMVAGASQLCTNVARTVHQVDFQTDLRLWDTGIDCFDCPLSKGAGEADDFEQL
jgi:hypothetical protein